MEKKFLTRGRTTRFDVKIEVGCRNGNHGKTIHIYEGNSKYIAEEVQKAVQRRYNAGGHKAVLEWYDNYFDEFLEVKKMEERWMKEKREVKA